jgi:hypothetical protein
MPKKGLIGKPNGMFLTRTRTTTDCRRYNSTLRRASQVPTIRVPRKDYQDCRRTKGLKTSLVLSATNAARKAITRATITPGSSIINYKDLNQVGYATIKLSELRRALRSEL